MFEEWAYQRQLQRFQKWRDDAKREELKKIDKTLSDRHGKSPEELAAELSSSPRITAINKYNIYIKALRSNYLEKQAERLFIPVPPFSRDNPDWVFNMSNIAVFLTVEAQNRLEDQIRAVKAARSANLLQWAPIWIGLLGALGGVVGAFTGLIVVLDKTH